MKIKDLPSVIKKRANVYIKKEFPIKKHKPKYLMQAFDWSDTIEGSEYWILVHDGRFLDAENHLREKKGDDLKEELFEIEKKPFFLDEVLDIKVNNPEVVKPNHKLPWYLTTKDAPIFNSKVEVVPYKDEYVKIDPIVDIILDKFVQRSRVGIEKYGTTLGRNDLSLEEWINHAQEEAMDLCLYLTKIKEEIKKKNN